MKNIIQMTKYKVKMLEYGTVIEHGFTMVNAKNKDEAIDKAIDKADDWKVKFTHDNECPDGWEHTVENIEVLKK